MSAIPNVPASSGGKKVDKAPEKPFNEITCGEKLKYAFSQAIPISKIAPSFAYEPKGWSPGYITECNTRELSNKTKFGISALTAIKFTFFLVLVGLFVAFVILVPPVGLMASMGLVGSIMQAMSFTGLILSLMRVCYKLILLKTPIADQRRAFSDKMAEMGSALLKNNESDPFRVQHTLEQKKAEKEEANNASTSAPTPPPGKPQTAPAANGQTPVVPGSNAIPNRRAPLTKATANRPPAEEIENIRKKTVFATRDLRTRGVLTQRVAAESPNYRQKDDGSLHIYTVKSSTFQVTQQLLSKGLNPALLDMANKEGPGGGQEGHLCRQSTLGEGLDAAQQAGLYPIPANSLIYVPEVLFYKDDQGNTLSEQPRADVIALAAYDCRPGGDQPANNHDYEHGMKQKMRAFCRAALHRGKDSLVLSAFGCGIFENNPRLVSQWFRDVLHDDEFKGKFKAIVFAITEDDKLAAFKQHFPRL